MEYIYYPGCSLEASARGYDESMRFVFKTLGLELKEIDDWNCCGATSYMSTKETISHVISARNLALAEKHGHDLVAPCSACYTILYKTDHMMKENFIMRGKVNQALRKDNLHYNLNVKVRHPLEILALDVGVEAIASKAVRSLNGLKIAQYYGCQIVRPDRGLDDKDDPRMMDSLFAALGCENVNFPLKVQCCGGMLMTTFPDLGLDLNRKILDCAQDNEAQVIVTTCPLCQINLEGYQSKINKKYNTDYNIPVIFFTQALGLALGGSPRELGLNRALIPFNFTQSAAEGIA